MKLYVGNLHHSMTETDRGALFSSHGPVLKVNLTSRSPSRAIKRVKYDGVDGPNGPVAANVVQQ